MDTNVKQQILISGLGGQGVLFVTRLLAEAAIARGLPVCTSETHGMAQRGGTVVSHFKVGDFHSPLIRPGKADGLLVLKAENVRQHGAYLRAGGWAVVNAGNGQGLELPEKGFSLDADELAQKTGNVKSLNLVMLGFALAVAEKSTPDPNRLFSSFAEIRAVIAGRFGDKEKQMSAFLAALQAGYAAAAA
jgi:indolepyruvate ferredoxin oxidoreductase beta subunit